MFPRLNFAPFRTHYFFLITTVLAIIGWFLAFIGQAISTAQFGNRFVGVLWFAIFLQASINLGVIAAVATDSVQTGRIQIAVFSAIATVFAVHGVDAGIFPVGTFDSKPALNTMAAGYFTLTAVDLLWVLYFTSEEDSLALHVINRRGTGGLSPATRRRRTRGQSVVSSAAPSYTSKHNYYTMGGAIGADELTRESKRRNSLARSGTEGSISSRRSLVSSTTHGMSSEPASSTDVAPPMPLPLPIPQPPPMPQASSTPPPEPPVPAIIPVRVPNVSSAESSKGGEEDAAKGGEEEVAKDGTSVGTPFVRARALHAYKGSPDDANELSFAKNEILEIEDQAGKWWEAKKSDGSLGIVPSNYLVII
ncbi:hypothetical protein C8R43DRAFT_1115865 [Mycena crocata]|nr:hypothetical protein C8R43DRAFT_1115865 [Mycena crocata]